MIRDLLNRKNACLAASGSGILLGSGSAFAGNADTAVTALATAATDAGLIGAGVLAVFVAIMAFKYIRRAF